jgi:uncharacterized membrane protein
MKMLGHPFHMMLIHFPTALLPMDILLSFLAYYNKDSSLMMAAFYCIAVGVLTGLLAIITGLIDLLMIPKENKAGPGTALIHGFINGTVLLLFGVFAYKSWKIYPDLSIPALPIILIKTALLITLFIGNYLGGKLILQHHIGVKI